MSSIPKRPRTKRSISLRGSGRYDVLEDNDGCRESKEKSKESNKCQERGNCKISNLSKSSDVPSELDSLVHLHRVPTSSKDHNRSMYPRSDKSKNKRSLPCEPFVKASKLLKKSSAEKKVEDKIEEDVVLCKKTSLLGTNLSNRRSERLRKRNFDEPVPSSSKLSLKSKINSCNSKHTSLNLSNKIYHYFKPKACLTKHKTPEAATTRIDDGNPETSDAQLSSGSSKGESSSKIFKGETRSKILKGKTDSKMRKGETRSKICEEASSKSSPEKNNEKLFNKYRLCYDLVEELSDKYGIEEECPNYFERLPHHIIKEIFCQIPFTDLMQCRLVCSLWNDTIQDPQFSTWKKRYFSYKMDHGNAKETLDEYCKDFGMRSIEDCCGVLLKFISQEFNRKPSSGIYDILMKNSNTVIGEKVIEERYPELLKKESKVWCIIAVTVLISVTAEEIYSLFKSLLTASSACFNHDIIEAFYCIATFLLHFKNTIRINHGLHYRVYNALYWIENDIPPKGAPGCQSLRVLKGLPGQQSIHSFGETSKPYFTVEQLRILNHCLQPGQIIKIVALAGTGKTTALVNLAQLYPQLKFLIVMFNKAICNEAQQRFPSNVTCKTAHSLAYKIHGFRLRYKLVPKIRPHDIVTLLDHHARSHLNITIFAKCVLKTLENFMSSVDVEISIVHVPSSSKDQPNSASEDKRLSEHQRELVLRDAQQLWRKMIDTDEQHRHIKITHDVYLKLYQLSRPNLREYQCLMIDEAQDCNPAMLDILLSQGLPVILVGDPNQQIYGFRGAKNALQNTQATHTYYLTKSFRFGPEIAYVASCCLEILKLNHKQTLVGSNQESCIEGKVKGQYAIIARTNITLFNEAYRMCWDKRFKNDEPTFIRGCFAGGIKSYGFDQMLDIWKLLTQGDGPGPSLTDRFIARFHSINDLGTYADNAEDYDLMAKIDFVKEHPENLPQAIKAIKKMCHHKIESANVVFSTAHKAKGLEFDTVCLTEDYAIPSGVVNGHRRFEVHLRNDSNNILGTIDPEECNIFYVALTRAKKSLILSDKLLRVLLLASEKFEYPILSSKLLEVKPAVTCINCSLQFVPHTVLTLARHKIYSATGHIFKGGALCMKCALIPTCRPRVQFGPVVMYLDPIPDNTHRYMSPLIGPLPSDAPIIHNIKALNEFNDVFYVINLNMNNV